MRAASAASTGFPRMAPSSTTLGISRKHDFVRFRGDCAGFLLGEAEDVDFGTFALTGRFIDFGGAHDEGQPGCLQQFRASWRFGGKDEFQCFPYFFSPASMATGSVLAFGGSGQVAKAVKAHGGFFALLKSRSTTEPVGMAA